MKKIVKYLTMPFLFGIGIMFCLNMNVKALNINIYNGDSSTPPTGPGVTCDETLSQVYFCRFKLINSAPRGIRVSFVYYDGSSYTQMGSHLDIWAVDPYKTQNLKHTSRSSGIKTTGGTLTTGAFSAGYQYTVMSGLQLSSSYLEKEFLQQEVMDAYARELVGCGISDKNAACYNETWGKENQKADKSGANPAQKGYRFLIEPIRGYATSSDGFYVMTLTEYARIKESGTRKMWTHFSDEDLLWTTFEDIGIQPVTSCRSVKCTAADVANPRKGHALQIIDFYDFLSPKCDYETGEGFPKDKKRGDKLTEQEADCCEEKLKEIEEKYKGMGQTPEQCMLVSDSVPSFINCMAVYFRGNAEQEQLWEQKKQELLEFDEKYPACSEVGCEFQPLIQIEETYISCVQSMDTITWMNSIIQCKDTTCEINYKSELWTYKENHLRCKLDEWEKRIPTHDCTISPICDEDNPNHFPKPGDENPDMTCCIYFENQMKLEYAQQGLSESEISKKINEWFNEPGKEFRLNCLQTKCSLDDPAPFTEKCCKELMEAYPEKPKEFWIEKGCDTSEEDECRWHDYADDLIEDLKQMIGANCAGSTSVEAKDTEKWVCIYKSGDIAPGTKEEVFIDYYVKYSNPYCAVYCREDVKYDFPDGSMIVKAGNHFTVGDTGHAPEWKSVQFSSTRECQTHGSTRESDREEINTEQFEEDWEKANDKVISTWDTWKIAQQKDWSYAHSKQSPEKNCDYRCVRWGTCGNKESGYYRCCKEKKPFGYTMYPATVYYAPFDSGNQNVTPGTWCSTLGHPDPGSAAKAKIHQKAKEDMETIETDIHACTSWNEFDSYRYASFSHTNVKAERYSKYQTYKDFVDYKEFNPDLTINYDEFTHDEYDYNDLLKKDELPTTSDNNFSTTGKRFTIKYKCPPTVAPGHLTCQKVVVFDYSPQKKANSTYFKEIKYTLQDGVFSTILKPQGIAVNGSESGSSSSQIYIDLGYSALHVHFMTPSGKYDIGLTYPGFTPGGNVEGGFEHNFDKLVDDDYKYDCTYIVHNEIIENDDPNCEGDNCFPCKTDNCDPAGLKGLNLIYRPISLGEPFPGLNGEGRSPGSNWSDTGLVENFITNNRGVNGSAIYQKAPMYQITLTPAVIQQIRKYNESTTYNDFNMDCTSEGKECKSYFIRGNVEDSSYNFSNYFQSCSISGNRGSTTCCGVGNWNDCDEKDGITRR